jgi:hypothetical protein
MRKDHVRQMGATPVLPVSLRGAMAGWLKASLCASSRALTISFNFRKRRLNVIGGCQLGRPH